MLSRTNRTARQIAPGQLALYVLLTLFAAFFAVPIIWLVIQVVDTEVPDFLRQWLFNSAFYSAAGVAIAVAVCLPAGYAIATHDFPGRRALLILTMLMMLIPPTALVLPLFLEANSVHLLTSPLAVILPYGLFPFGVYLSYVYFNTDRFNALFQTARIDGCTEWEVFRRIAVPLSKPVTALIVFLNFLASWTNYFLPWVMYWTLSTTNRYPLSLGIALDLYTGATTGPSLGVLQLQVSAAETSIELTLFAMAAPVVIVLVLAQRWIGTGQFQGVFR